ncbi:tandem-95 repeat protein [Sphingobacteriales bacterium UPWRP_1]|nr:hypothetical protein BVG80_03290 [Sphingobacteriales bacterium TSM_CSM]PSJ73390.1 tandem-95 repeat protein [Sphingobacteriales bacterium UPWRP_1]
MSTLKKLLNHTAIYGGYNNRKGYLVAVKQALVVLLLFFGLYTQAQNNPPLVDTLTYCTGPMTPVVLCNSYIDPDGDHAAVVGGHTTFNCSLVFLNDTCVRYTPLPGFLGTDIVYLDVCDDQTPAACSVTVIYVHVGCLPPVAANDQALISDNSLTFNGIAQPLSSGGTFELPVLGNDDPLCPNNTMSVSVVLNAPDFGAYSIAADGGSLLYTPNPGFSGTDVITYVNCNNCPLCDTATVVINVESVVTPGCNPDIYVCIPPLGAVDLCPEFCDIDNADITDYEYSATIGTLNMPDADGCLAYYAPEGFTGEDIAAITACDGQGNCSTTFAFITVSENCDAAQPQAVDDAVTTQQNVPVSVNVLENDINPDGQPLSITAITQPQYGIATIASGGVMVYTPDAGYSGSDSFTYQTCNPAGNCATATVYVQVTQPCENYTETCTSQATPVEFCVSFCNLAGLGNAVITGVSASFNSSLSQMPGNCITYTPLPLFTGADTVVVTACTASGICDTAYVAIQVGCNVPDAENDSAQTMSGLPVSINVTANDTPFCNDVLTVELNQQPANGTATVLPDGTVSYLPNAGFSGIEVFDYTVCAPCSVAACKTATVTVMVSPFSTPEIEDYLAQPDVATTPFGTSVTIPVLENDLGTGLDIVSYSLANNGVVVPNTDGTFTYIPFGGFSGTDYFFYQICNDSGICQQTIVAITVLPAGTAPQPPAANNDMAETAAATPVTISVLANDTDPEGMPLTISGTLAPNNGSVITNANGTITYTPNPGFTGIDHFSYIVCDAQGLCATASVAVAVGVPPGNQYPFTDNDHAQTLPSMPVNIMLFDNDIEPDGQPLAATILSAPMQGAVTVNPATGIATYTPNTGFQGVDYFTYMACDNGSPALCDTAYVSITVGNGNVPPVAQDDTAFGVQNATVFILVILNDSDANNPLGELTITSLPDGPQNGTATINGPQIIYVPNPGFAGTDQFTYLLCDPAGDCDEATVTVIITADVSAVPDVATTPQNTPVTFNVLSNDSGANISVTDTTNPANGTVTVSPSGIITYMPDTGFSGSDSFTYTICDNAGNCDEATVAITVTAVVPNQPPIALNDVAITTPDTPVQIPVLDNDTDPEGQPLVISTATQPQHGTSIIEGNIISYFPDAGYTGTDLFTYVVCDPQGLCDTAVVAINVGSITPGNEPPLAVNDTTETFFQTPVLIDVLANDTDPDGDEIVILLLNNAQNGTVEQFGTQVQYTPGAGTFSTDEFTYIITDPSGSTDTATVTITILMPPAEEVAAVNDTAQTNAGQNVFIAVLNNDTFNPAAGQPQVNILTQPQNGTALTDMPGGIVTYIPNPGFSGTDVFTYSLCVNEVCDTATVTIVVSGFSEEDCLLTPAQAFSPNADGVNDLFLISGADSPCFENISIELTIFNRWGDVMHADKNYTNSAAWNGLWQSSGMEAPSGTYFYVLQFINPNQQLVRQTGYIELLR